MLILTPSLHRTSKSQDLLRWELVSHQVCSPWLSHWPPLLPCGWSRRLRRETSKFRQTSHERGIPLIAEVYFSKQVNAAGNTKTNNPLSSPTVILDRANAELFAPHGLFALVVASRSDE